MSVGLPLSFFIEAGMPSSSQLFAMAIICDREGGRKGMCKNV
jgi:hypothetical protein